MNTKIASFFLTNFLLVTVVACTDARTTSEAPAPNATSSSSPTTTSAPKTQAAVDDAQSETRKKQLDADIRSREQRNNAVGDKMTRPDGDLASEVRSKLEANIPKGNLTVESKDANVVVSGTAPSLNELNKIKSLAMEIKGVKSVTIKAVAASN